MTIFAISMYILWSIVHSNNTTKFYLKCALLGSLVLHFCAVQDYCSSCFLKVGDVRRGPYY